MCGSSPIYVTVWLYALMPLLCLLSDPLHQDNDFYARVGDNLNIIRMHERGLTHVWHEKDCKLGAFVENDFFKAWYV